MSKNSVLYIWLPCRKVFPAGPASLAAYVHQKRPNVRQRLLDLSLIKKNERLGAISDTVEEFKPDIIAFSWRDIQIYAPHGQDDSLELAFNFYYSPNIFKKLLAGIRGISMVFTYENHLKEKLKLINKTIKKFPGKTCVVGGGAFSVFHKEIIKSLPEGVIGVIGEGEDVLVSLIDETDVTGCRVSYKKCGEVFTGRGQRPVPVSDLTVDYQYIESIFPQAPSYFGETIGIQTKRGCPFHCEFCLYSFIEGHEVRYRDPARIIDEMNYLYSRWKVRKIWFADAQFIPGSHSLPHCAALLEGIIRSNLRIEWSGYIRTSLITPDLAELMVSSGVGDLEVSVTSGSQAVLNEMSMGFRLDNLYEGCRYLKKAGYRGRIILNYSINAPGETEETLLESINSYKAIAKIMGSEQVQCVIFFLGVQPHTGLESRLIENGYLGSNYDPISLNPFSIRKLLYNPPPLDRVIARSCLDAWKDGADSGEKILYNLEKRLGRK
ncbi:MAG: radical SAM protein [Nitrospirae bacterium]|nr:radical SAM protein [Nitrospirota bacterium]